MKRWLWALLALLFVLPAGGTPLNDQPNWRVAEFTSNPAAVVVDVVDLATGSQVGNNLATTQVSRDSNLTVAWRFDLATVTGYPVNCEAKSYLVTFVPDAADCQATVNPDLCASEVVQVGGAECLEAALASSPDYVHTSTVVTGQGISQEVLDFFNARGILPLKWVEFRVAGDLDFATPDVSVWVVYFYTDASAAPRLLCTVPTASDPAVSLPSSTHCGT